MRVVFVVDDTMVNGIYRSIVPMLALEARGHQTRQLDPSADRTWAGLVRWCDVLHIHRVCDEGVVGLARSAKEQGVAVVWDDDDDVTKIARDMPGYRTSGGIVGQRRLTARRRIFELADLVTTPSEHLAGIFRAGGASRVRVIENYVGDETARARDPSSDTLVVGWTGGSEHRHDVERLPLRTALQRLLDACPDVRVHTIGTALGLEHARYGHVKRVEFRRLLREVSAFDIGIAPIAAELPINQARSNVKLKEYAAAGVPWLASPIGPYAGMGERQGGRLVADDQWFEQLERLVRDKRARRKLAKRAERWGRGQTITRNAHLWEDEFTNAISRARAA